MSNTNDQFAQDINNSFRGLYSSLFTAFELYVNNFLKKEEELEAAIVREDSLNYFKQKLANSRKKKNDNEDNEDALKRLISYKENKMQSLDSDDISIIFQKKGILAEQAVVYCCSVFESFRVRLVEVLFKNSEESNEAYLRVFKEVASAHALKSKDTRYTNVLDKDAIKPKNLKLIQNNNKFNSLEKQVFNLNLEDPVFKDVYERNFAAYIVFRELRNAIVHRKTNGVSADEIFYNSIKRGVGSAEAQKKSFKKTFESVMGFSWEKKREIHLEPNHIFKFITHILNLSYLYCLSIANKSGFYLVTELFNDVLVDFKENRLGHVYFNFFVYEDIIGLHNKVATKDPENDSVKLVNFILASDVVKQAFPVGEMSKIQSKKIEFFLNDLKKIDKESLYYEIVDSFLKRDLIKLTDATDKYLLSTNQKKHNLFGWYIFKKLKDEPFIEMYLNRPLKKT